MINNVPKDITSMLPDHISDDYPIFNEFIQAYYNFLNESNGPDNIIKNVLSYTDIDETVDAFKDHIFNELMPQLPTNMVVNKSLLAKHIKELYNKKGTEDSYRLLFRILFDKEITINYPVEQILKLSDGKWIQKTSFICHIIKTVADDVVKSATNNIIVVNLGSKTIPVKVLDVIRLDSTNITYNLYEFFIVKDFFDDFNTAVNFTLNEISSVDIITSGFNYTNDDEVVVVSSDGGGSHINISTTLGKITGTNIVNSGVGFFHTPIFNIISTKGAGGYLSASLDSIYTGTILPSINNISILRTSSSYLEGKTYNMDYYWNNINFSRSTIGTVVDFEGLVKSTKINEARFNGARRVANVCTYSEDFTYTTWTKSATPPTLTTGIADPFGGFRATRMTANSSNSTLYKSNTGTTAGTYINSIWIRRVSGTGIIEITTPAGADAIITSAVTSSWERITLGPLATPSTCRAGVGIVTSGNVIDIFGFQSENVTGQTNQSTSEYVSTNILGYPYHGAGIDGVKYFNTTNGNTVSSNVVTEGIGTTISDITLLIEPARTNLLLNSAIPVTQDITTTAQTYVVSMYGTGTCILTGTASGTLIGSGATTRTFLVFTATSGTLTLTFSGTNSNGQVEAGTTISSYIATVASPVIRQADIYNIPPSYVFDPSRCNIANIISSGATLQIKHRGADHNVKNISILSFGAYYPYEFNHVINKTPNILQAVPIVTAGVITSVVIVNGGYGYTVPPVATIIGVGTGAHIIFTLTDDVVTGYAIIDGGYGYIVAPVIITSDTSIAINVSNNKLRLYNGEYISTDGFTSSDMVIYDGNYYQQYSYEIVINELFDIYKGALKKILHPAGYAVWGVYDLQKVLQIELTNNKIELERDSGFAEIVYYTMILSMNVQKQFSDTYATTNVLEVLRYNMDKSLSDSYAGTSIAETQRFNTAKRLSDSYAGTSISETQTFNVSKSLADSSTQTELLAFNISKSLSDSSIITELLTIGDSNSIGISKSLTDVYAGTSVTETQRFVMSKALSDTYTGTSITETQSFNTSKVLSDTYTGSSITDTKTFNTSKALSDSVSYLMGDPTKSYVTSGYFAADYLYVAEFSMAFGKSLVDSVTATESLNIVRI